MTVYDETGDIGLRLSRAEHRLTAAQSRAQAIEAIRATARTVCGSDGICIVLREGTQDPNTYCDF